MSDSRLIRLCTSPPIRIFMVRGSGEDCIHSNRCSHHWLVLKSILTFAGPTFYFADNFTIGICYFSGEFPERGELVAYTKSVLHPVLFHLES